jgi:putative DNA methylase
VSGLERGGVFRARGGEAKLLSPTELSGDWDPVTDVRTSVWEATVRIAKALEERGAPAAADLMGRTSGRVSLDAVQELAYLLYNTCERLKRTKDALLFNGLGTSWTELSEQARHQPAVVAAQGAFDFGSEDDL